MPQNHFFCTHSSFFIFPSLDQFLGQSRIDVPMSKWSRKLLVLHLSILITQISSFSTKVEHMPDPSIKCGECFCAHPCSQQPPTPLPPPPPSIQYISTPPPRFVYVTGVTPPPPPPLPIQYIGPPPPRFVYVTGVVPPPPSRFVYMTGPAGNLYGSDPFNWQIYSNAPHICTKFMKFVLVLVFSALQLLVVW